jgi:hypothetical protein
MVEGTGAEAVCHDRRCPQKLFCARYAPVTPGGVTHSLRGPGECLCRPCRAWILGVPEQSAREGSDRSPSGADDLVRQIRQRRR